MTLNPLARSHREPVVLITNKKVDKIAFPDVYMCIEAESWKDIFMNAAAGFYLSVPDPAEGILFTCFHVRILTYMHK